MSTASWWEFLVMIPAIISGTYLILWAIPGIITFSIISLGSYKYIIYIDKQLAKNLDKYYDEKGYMKPHYQISSSIGSRFSKYCLAYPFIRKRVSTNSIKFKFFMWVNALGYWSFWGTGFFVLLAKGLDIIP